MTFFKAICLLTLLSFVKAGDYYDLLGVTKDADNRDIRRAFKKLALKLHPDKNPNDKNAHDEFVKMNRAYEVLKDADMRKKYDLHGEAGLEDDFGKSWKGSYQSWNYYYESFGIYDDDPEIITLSRSDFEQSVLGSPDVWFVNFYSPQCSHCHHLAPNWRALARELEGVIRIGAVNCEEDWALCRQQHIDSYPSLVMYPEKEKYYGSRESEDMISYVLGRLPNKIIHLTANNFDDTVSEDEYKAHPWLIYVCSNDQECGFTEELRKLCIILDGMVNVADAESSEKLCEKINCQDLLTYYENMTVGERKGHAIEETEAKDILHRALKFLPGPEKLSDDKFEEIKVQLESPSSDPWLIQFVREDGSSHAGQETELKRLRGLLPNVKLGCIDCQTYASLCKSLSVRKFPTFVIFKPGGSHEFNHGRSTAHDIATFVRESLSSRVKTLSPDDFPTVTHSSEAWFIDFYAPWCPPCMQLLPEWRKVSRTVGHLVKFGTVDCTVHSALCNQYNIRSYPTTILFNQSVPHQYHGSHSKQPMEDFVKDMLNPLIVSLSEQTFQQRVMNKSPNEIWAIDFFAPWCGPCQQLGGQWRKLAKMMKDFPQVHIAQVDCTAHDQLCTDHGIRSYPTIRLYPHGSKGVSKFHFYNEYNRDASSLQSWIHSFLPTKVSNLDLNGLKTALSHSEPWLIDYYAPWCGYCKVFAPEFEKIATKLEGKVNAGKVDCQKLPDICQIAAVRAYPTVMFYPGSQEGQTQNPIGEEMNVLTYQGIVSILEKRLEDKLKVSRDEL